MPVTVWNNLFINQLHPNKTCSVDAEPVIKLNLIAQRSRFVLYR
jgi:hypothetical protein